MEPHFIKFFSNWNDPGQMGSDEYISLMLNSVFVPCPKGQNVETYRFYEALECGCIPLCIDIPPVCAERLPLMKMESWEHAVLLMQHFMRNKEVLEKYRATILITWASFKQSLKEKIKDF